MVRCLRDDIKARTREANSGAAASKSAHEAIGLILRLGWD
jgi:hypothetical protein